MTKGKICHLRGCGESSRACEELGWRDGEVLRGAADEKSRPQKEAGAWAEDGGAEPASLKSSLPPLPLKWPFYRCLK